MTFAHSTPETSLSWNKVWLDALTRPSVTTYENFLRDVHATHKRAFIWIIIGGMIGGAISALAQPTQTEISPIVIAICGAPVLAVLAVLSIVMIAGIIQLLARALGGTGTYSKLTYALATFNAPMTIISGLLVLIPYGLLLLCQIRSGWC